MPARTPPHKGRGSVGTGKVVAKHAAAQTASSIFGDTPAGIIFRTRDIIPDHDIQTCAGAIAIVVRQYDAEAFTQGGVIRWLSMGLVIEQGVAVRHTPCPRHRIEADPRHHQLIAQGAGNRLRERGDDLAVADEADPAQGQALHAIRRTEGEGAAFGQVCSIRSTALYQGCLIQNKLTPCYLQPLQNDGLIHGGNGNGQG